MKPVLIFCLLFSGIFNSNLYACKCSNLEVAEKAAKSEFVATVKVLASVQDSSDKNYHDLKIEIGELFKGESREFIKVHSVVNTSCGFLPKVGSEWLVYANTFNGHLAFGRCSGNVNLDPDKWKDYSSEAYESNKLSVKRELDLLRYLKQNRLSLNEYSRLGVGFNEKLTGYPGVTGDFSVYTFTAGKQKSARKLKINRAFADPTLAKAVKKSLRQGLRDDPHLGMIAAGTKVTSVLFFHGRDGGYGYVSSNIW